MEIRFNKKMRIITSIFQIFSFIAIAANGMRAQGIIVSTVTGLSLPTAITVCTIILILYTMLGGLWAVTLTDLFQGLISTVGILWLSFTMLWAVGGFSGIMGAYAALGESSLIDLKAIPIGPSLTGFLVFFLGSLGFQDITLRCYAAKDEKTARNALLLFSLLYGFVVIFGSLVIGLSCRVLMPGVEPDFLLSSSLKTFLPPIGGAIVIIGIMAASMT